MPAAARRLIGRIIPGNRNVVRIGNSAMGPVFVGFDRPYGSGQTLKLAVNFKIVTRILARSEFSYMKLFR